MQSNKVALVFATLLLVALVEAAIISGDGVTNPSSYYQRFRRSEYPKNKPFYQWWYFTVKDLEHGEHFAMTYAYSEAKNTTTSGAFLMFVHFDGQDRVTGSRYIKLPLTDFSVSDYFDVRIGAIGRVEPLSNDTIRITGKMTGANWYCSGKAVDCKGDIEWDLTIDRIYGWYGQKELETPSHYDSVISWNTYAHDSKVEGYIKFPSQKKLWVFNDLTCNKKCRAYCDQNWGLSFPHPPKKDPLNLNYAWGWYSMVVPSDGVNPELGFILGSGTTETGFPLYTMTALFGDLRIGDWHVGARQGYTWENSWVKNKVLDGTNDGKIVALNITRSDWRTYVDDHGNASLPFTQNVYLETTNSRTTMSFLSKEDEYVRLLFAFDGDIFSDFEAVGVTVVYKVEQKVGGKWQVVAQGKYDNGGLEFGYYVPGIHI